MSRDSARGVTLVELLVVIAVTAILPALLLPAVQSARNGTRHFSNVWLLPVLLPVFEHNAISSRLDPHLLWQHTTKWPGGGYYGYWTVPETYDAARTPIAVLRWPAALMEK